MRRSSKYSEINQLILNNLHFFILQNYLFQRPIVQTFYQGLSVNYYRVFSLEETPQHVQPLIDS